MKAISFIKKHYKYILFCAVFLGVNALFVSTFHSSISGWKWLIVTGLLFVQLALCTACFYLRKVKNWEHHHLFLLFAIVIGLLYIFAMPPGTPPDEPAHFRRAYEVSEGRFISQRSEENGEGGDYLPETIMSLFEIHPNVLKYRDMPDIISKTSRPANDGFQKFGTTALYSPIVYLPQAIGILIGRILHLPLIAIFYLARIFNLTFWILLGYYAIKKLPFGKNILLLILFLPISMQAAASCQADAITNASTIALFAFVLNKIAAPKVMTRKEYCLAAILAMLVSMSKIVYVPFCFLLLLIPKKCFKTKKEKILKAGGILIAVIVINLLWLAISAGFLTEFNEGVNSGEQVKFILANPIRYLGIIGSTILEKGTFYFFSFMGSSLSWFSISLVELYFLFLAPFILFVYLQENKKGYILVAKQKSIILAIAIICTGLIFTSIYVQWDAVGTSPIEGVQGRYFIPLALPLLFLIKPIANRTKKNLTLYTFALISAISIHALTAITIHYMLP